MDYNKSKKFTATGPRATALIPKKSIPEIPSFQPLINKNKKFAHVQAKVVTRAVANDEAAKARPPVAATKKKTTAAGGAGAGAFGATGAFAAKRNVKKTEPNTLDEFKKYRSKSQILYSHVRSKVNCQQDEKYLVMLDKKDRLSRSASRVSMARSYCVAASKSTVDIDEKPTVDDDVIALGTAISYCTLD